MATAKKKTTAKERAAAKKSEPVEDVPTSPDVEPPRPAETTEVTVKAQPGALVAQEPHPLVLERINEALEALESFDDMKLQPIGFGSEGFTLIDGEDPVDEFTGIMLFTKESNVYYKGVYKAGQNLPPDCSSIDGKTPNVEEPQSPNCKKCPLNQYGSSATGEGKACKNTRPTFFLVGTGVIPKVLRVPPTSLKNIKKYVLNVATNYGSYFAVKTQVSIYKEDAGQTYNNIRFKVAGRVVAETVVEDDEVVELGKKDVKAIRAGWLGLMKSGNFGIDEQSDEAVTQADAPPAPDEAPVDPENPQF